MEMVVTVHAGGDSMPGRHTRARAAGTTLRLVLAALVLLGGPAGAGAQASQGTGEVVEGAKKIGKGVEEAAKGVGKTVTEGAKEVGHKAAEAGKETKPAAEKVGSTAKSFGKSVWEGMKSVGHSVKKFFTGD
jgi:hypothetical protein